jgi:hypothetical protein
MNAKEIKEAQERRIREQKAAAKKSRKLQKTERACFNWWRDWILDEDLVYAESAWNRGATRFAKLPVMKSGEAAGLPRPLWCPEPPPKGGCFELTWDDGTGFRRSSLKELVFEIISPLVDKARRLYNESLQEYPVEKLVPANDDDPEPDQRDLVYEALEKAFTQGASDDVIALAFLAGYIVSHRRIMNQHGDAIRRESAFKGRNPDSDAIWSEILEGAVERHQVSPPTEIMKILGLKRDELNNVVFDPPVEWGYWAYMPKAHLLPSLHWSRFETLVQNAKKKIRRVK